MNIIKLFILQIITIIVISCSTNKQESIVELNSNWEFKSENDKDLFLKLSESVRRLSKASLRFLKLLMN